MQYSDMNEEMRVEAMELCVTACEKHSSSNEVSYLEMLVCLMFYLSFPSSNEVLLIITIFPRPHMNCC